MSPRSALLIAAFDSQLKWCAGIRDELESRGFSCRVVVPDTRSALSARQIRDAGFDGVEHVDWSTLVASAIDSDVVVCSLAGPMTHRLSVDLARALPDGAVGPVLVSGWVGIIIEKITAGYLDRSGTDVVAVNSSTDLEHFRRTADALGMPADNLVLSGLPFLSADPAPQREGPIMSVLFADQPTVPREPAERLHVYRRLIAYARRHPERDVVLKPRHRPGEDTFHRMAHHPEDLLAGEDRPAGFRIDYTPIAEVLPRTDLMLTMSSTACLEAVDHGCRVALVLDLGVHERYGNHVFLDSGLLRSFDQIDADDIGTPAPAWHDSYFGDRDRPSKRVVVDRVEALLASGERPSRRVWESAPFRASIDLADARKADQHPWMSAAWSRRVRRHGPLAGTAAYGGSLALPPAVTITARRLARTWRT